MKKKLLFAVAMMLAAVGAKAQTDVTSTYLTNADFSQSTPIDNHLCGYGKDMDSPENNTTYYGAQTVDGWSFEVLRGETDTEGYENSGMGGAVFAYGSSWEMRGKGVTAPAANPAGVASGNCLGFFGVWGCGGYYYQEVELSAGGYELTIPVYNQSGTQGNTSYIGFIPNEGSKHVAACNPTVGQWTTQTVKFTLTEKTAGRIALGYQSTGSGSAANPMIYFDGVTIKWTDPLKALKAEYNDALDEANLALDNSDYINVQGTERTNLAATLIAKPAETEAGYTAAIEALNSATAAFKNAKSSYDELAEINAAAAKLGLEELSAESGDEAIEQAHVQNVAVYNKVNADFTFPVSLGSWTETGATQQIHDQHWDGTTGNGASTYYEPNQWGAGSVNWEISQTLAGLPAGDYVLMATGRRSGDVTMTMSAAGESVSTFPNADFGLGVDKSGAANFGEGDFANNGAGRGWQWRYIPFTLTEAGDVEISVTATAPTTHQWCSICEFRLLAKPEAETAIAKAELLAAINQANAVDKEFNVGTSVFQKVPSAAEDFESIIGAAQDVYDDSKATLEAVEASTVAVKQAIDDFANAPVNAPEAGKKYYITEATPEHPYEGNAIVAGLGAITTNNPTGYVFNVKSPVSDYLAQGFTFTSAEDAENPNNYYISIELPEGTVYLTNGTNNASPASWAPSQIQGTTNSEAKMAFRIAASSTVEGAFNIYNTATNSTIAAQAGGNIYTEPGNAEFALADVTKAKVETAIAEGMYATRIYPFVPEAIGDVTYYSCEAVSEKELTLTEVTELAANTPYILFAESEVNDTQEGFGMAAADTYTAGYLTGTFASVEIPVGSYVLQTLNDFQAFYKVEAIEAAYMSAPYRAYLTVPGYSAKTLGFGGDATAISTIEALTSGNFEGIYNAAGAKLNRMEKGVNIIRMTDGTTRKVMIK